MDEIHDRADAGSPANGTAAEDRAEKKPREHPGSANLRPPWPKGVSGNPGGRPKGKSLTARLHEWLDQDEISGKRLPGGKLVADLIIEALGKQALKGDPRHILEIFNRVDGRVTQRLDVTSKGESLIGGLLSRLDAHDLATLERIADKMVAGGPGGSEGGDPGGVGAAEPD